MFALTYFTLSFALTLWLSHFLIKYVDPAFFIDKPQGKKIHTKPMSRYGGIAFGLITIILGWFVLNESGIYNWYFLGAFSILILGAIDDHLSVSWHIKLPVQIFIGTMIIIQFFPTINELTIFNYRIINNRVLIMGLYLFWFIGLTNAVNLIDGLDGLAGGVAFLIIFTCAVVGYFIGGPAFMHLNIILSAALLAFLHFNLQPSHFFMGDSGSLFLGYHLAVMPIFIIVSQGSTATHLDLNTFILMSSFLIADTCRVFFERVKNGSNPLLPDQCHFHYLMYRKSNSHTGTLLAIYALTGIGCILVPMAPVFKTEQNLIFMILYILIVGMFIFFPFCSEGLIMIFDSILQPLKRNSYQPIIQEKLFRVRDLPIALSCYFITLILMKIDRLAIISIFQLVVLTIVFGTILLLWFNFSLSKKRPGALLVMIAVLQVFFIFIGLEIEPLEVEKSNLDIFISWLRYGSLSVSAIVVILNFIIFDYRLMKGFWSLLDILFLMIIIGFSGLQPLGFGVPVTFIIEVIIVYFSAKLYVFPRNQK